MNQNTSQIDIQKTAWHVESSIITIRKEPASTSVISSHCQRFVDEIHRCFWVKNPPCILKNSSVVRFIDATHVRM